MKLKAIILYCMNKIKRLICEYDHPVLYLHIDGDICTGDLINFSYSMTRRLSKISGEFYLFCDFSNANFNLLDGLAEKVFQPFFEDASQKKLICGSILVSESMMEIFPSAIKFEKIKLFENDYTSALSWLSLTKVSLGAISDNS